MGKRLKEVPKNICTLASKWQAQLEQEEKGMKVSEKGVELMESL